MCVDSATKFLQPQIEKGVYNTVFTIEKRINEITDAVIEHRDLGTLFKIDQTAFPIIYSLSCKFTIVVKWLKNYDKDLIRGLDYDSVKSTELKKKSIIPLNMINWSYDVELDSKSELKIEHKCRLITNKILKKLHKKLIEQFRWLHEQSLFYPAYEIPLLPRSKTKLPFSMHLYADGKAYLHTGPVVGKGTFKKVTLGVNYPTCNLYAIAKMSEYTATLDQIMRENNNISLTKDIKGMVPTFANIISCNSKDVHKLTLIQPFYSEGDFYEFQVIERPEMLDLLHIYRDITLTLVNLHQKGLIHLDVKMENVLIYSQSVNDTIYKRAHLTDVCFLQNTRVENKLDLDGTPLYFPPEVFEMLLDTGIERTPENIFDPKRDIWTLGILFFLSYYRHDPPWFEIIGENPYNIFKMKYEELMKFFNESDPFFKEPNKQDLIPHLIWELLNIYPQNRPAADTVLERIYAIADAEKVTLIDD